MHDLVVRRNSQKTDSKALSVALLSLAVVVQVELISD
jgi:hypothetical protein